MAIVTPSFAWPLAVVNAQITFTSPASHTTTNRNTTYATIDAYLTQLKADLIAAGLTGCLIKPLADGRIAIGATIAWTWKATTTNGAKSALGWVDPVTAANRAVDIVAAADTATFGTAMFVVFTDSPHLSGWYPALPPKKDDLEQKDYTQNVITRTMSGIVREYSDVHLYERPLTFSFIPKEKTYNPATGYYPNTWENMFMNARGVTIQYYPDVNDRATSYACTMSKETAQKFAPKRMFNTTGLYEFDIGLWKYVT